MVLFKHDNRKFSAHDKNQHQPIFMGLGLKTDQLSKYGFIIVQQHQTQALNQQIQAQCK